MKGFKLNIIVPSRLIYKGNQIKPNFTFDIEGIDTFITCMNDKEAQSLVVKTKFSLDNIKMLETSALLDKNDRIDERNRNRRNSNSGFDKNSS